MQTLAKIHPLLLWAMFIGGVAVVGLIFAIFIEGAVKVAPKTTATAFKAYDHANRLWGTVFLWGLAAVVVYLIFDGVVSGRSSGGCVGWKTGEPC